MIQHFFFLVLSALQVCSLSPSSFPAHISALGLYLSPFPSSALCPHEPSTCSTPTRADGSQPCPSVAIFLVRVTEKHDFGTVMNCSPGPGQNCEAGDIDPGAPLSHTTLALSSYPL